MSYPAAPEKRPDLGVNGSVTASDIKILTVPLRATLSGRPLGATAHVVAAATVDRVLYAISVDTCELEPFVKQGSTLLIIPDEDPVSGDEVLIRLAQDQQAAHIVCRYVASHPDRGAVVAQTLQGEPVEYLLQDIEWMDPIYAVKCPDTPRPRRQAST